MKAIDHSKLLHDQLKGLNALVESLEDGDMRELCRFFLNESLSSLCHLKEHAPQAHQQADFLALQFASLATCLAGHFAGMNRDLEDSKRRGAEITSTQAWLVAEVARSIAVSAWAGDDLHEYRIGEMSAIVYRELERLGYAQRDQSGKQKPTLRAIREWIMTVAPGYAHDPGAEKKQDE